MRLLTGSAGRDGEGSSRSGHPLGREVAIKVRPEAFTRDSERPARFEGEVRVLAFLSHQNINGK